MRLSSLRRLVAGLAFLAFAAAAAPSFAAGLGTIDTVARNAIIVDFETGAILLDKDADQRIPPASMSKIMTEYVVFDYLKKGRATLDDMLPVSEKAWRTGGSKMFVPLGGRVRLEDLLRGMIVQSGNDACIVLAEGLAGSEAAFVEQMNAKAKEMGLTNTHFANVTGLPDPEEYTTVRDLATLARRIIVDFPEYYHYDSEKNFTYNGIKQGNRNPLLYKDLGADGMKTGHTEEAGYCLTGSAIRNGRRVVMVLAGMPTMKARITESERLLEWAYREFGDYHLVKAGDTIDEAPVWLGTATKVPVTVAKDIVVTLPRGARHAMKVTAVYEGSMKAPVEPGQKAGKLVVSAPQMAAMEFPLVAAKPVPRLGAFGRMAATAGYLLWGSRN